MRLPFNPKNHLFKAVGTLAGLVFLRGFGLIFGFIGGALIDQLTAGLRQKKRLNRFLENPNIADEDPVLISAAGASVVWYLCKKEPARLVFATAALDSYFPNAPRCCAESLTEYRKINYPEAAQFFGRYAGKDNIENLNNMIIYCGLDIAAVHAAAENKEAAEILKSAGVKTRKSDDTDYTILGLDSTASADDIKRQYYHLAAQFHPDSGAELSDEQRIITEDAFKRIQAAYERLREK